MRLGILIAAFCLPASLVAQEWSLVWSDEFDGDTLDDTKWVHDLGTGSQYGLWGWGNGELQYYQPYNTSVANGVATIEAREESNGIIDSWGNSSYYSSSKITTKGLFDFRYGKVEASIKSINGEGFWPAFWMLPTGGNWPCDGEIDIVEHWGSDYITNSTTGAAHLGACPYSSATHEYESFSSYLAPGSFADDFHTYGIVWREDTITWYVDDAIHFQVTPDSYNNVPEVASWPFNSNEWYIMINLAITQSGPSNNTVFPNNIQIDWVRVYQDGPISTEELPGSNLKVYPNPASNILNIEGGDLIRATLFNLEGRVVLSAPLLNAKTIDVQDVESGMYLLELEGAKGIQTKKIIIE